MPYFQLRITFSQTRTQPICLRAVKALIRHYDLIEHSCGIEQLNKYGEPCDPHIHFNFVADIERVNPKRCIQDWLRRHFQNNDIELRGNRMWSLQMVEEPQDYERWFRYTLKENPITELVRKEEWKDFTDDAIAEWKDANYTLAQEERKTSIEHNILRREKLRIKDQFKQKLYMYIKENTMNAPEGKSHIWCLIFEYYRKIEKPINFSVIEGYTNLWLADHGQLSAQHAYNLAHNL